MAQAGVMFHALPCMEQNALYQVALVIPGTSLDWGPNQTTGNTDTGQWSQNQPAYLPHWSYNMWHSTIPKSYVCPSDPTTGFVASPPYGGPNGFEGNIHGSYAVNGLVFPNANMTPPYNGVLTTYPGGIPDGTSNTMFFFEHYQLCYGYAAQGYGSGNCWLGGDNVLYNADEWIGPVNKDTGPGLSYPQFQPNWLTQCNDITAQGCHTAVILVGLGDGSVRPVSQGVSANTWWYAITPQGGEVLGSDW
jgi:hypothetical protein